MSTPKKDPVLAVIAYFETADLALAQQTLAIVQQTLKRRTPAAVRLPGRPVAKKKTKATTTAAAADSTVPIN